MGLWIQKYGGTSVASAERIRSVAARVARAKREGLDLVVVVSAMGSATDDLISLAHAVSKHPNHREMDMLLSTGERVSMALLSMALSDLGIEAQSFTGSQTGIITSSSHRRARIKKILGDRIRQSLTEGKVPIVAGFQGVSESKEITTLGRGGSDTTAVALAVALKADGCDIFTDVDGVFAVDPRLSQKESAWEEIPYDLMVELACLGAGVLHPRCVELAKKYGILLRVRNSLKSESRIPLGTTIVSRKVFKMESMKVAGVTADTEKAWISVEMMRPTVVGALWDRVLASGLTLVSPVFSESKVDFFSDVDSFEDWERILGILTQDGFVKSFRLESEWVPLSVVGDCFSTEATGLAKVFQCLADASVPSGRGSASALSVTVAVPKAKAEDGVKALHQAFFGESANAKGLL